MTTASYVTNVIQTTNGLNAVNLSAGVNAYVAPGVHISASGTGGVAGIAGPGGSILNIAGDVFGDTIGVYFYDSGENHILIADGGGVVSNTYGILDFGTNSVISNAGTVSGEYAIYSWGISADIHNFGMIHGGHYGVTFVAGSGTNLLTNSGVIDALAAVVGSAASDYVYNTGLITGTVLLNAGDDRFDNRGGTVQGTVYLGDGNDTMWGGAASDDIDGGNNDDILRGRGEDDRLDGGDGMDKLRGGDGDDSFVFSTALGATNVDTIVDFVHGEDQIGLSASIFAALGSTVSASEFLSTFTGHNAFNHNQHIIYDRSKGTLWYDADGHGGAHAVKVAQLGTTTNHPTNLDFHDFAIV